MERSHNRHTHTILFFLLSLLAFSLQSLTHSFLPLSVSLVYLTFFTLLNQSLTLCFPAITHLLDSSLSPFLSSCLSPAPSLAPPSLPLSLFPFFPPYHSCSSCGDKKLLSLIHFYKKVDLTFVLTAQSQQGGLDASNHRRSMNPYQNRM